MKFPATSRRPNIYSIRTIMIRQWRLKRGVNASLLDNRHVLLRFDEEQDQIKVLSRDAWICLTSCRPIKRLEKMNRIMILAPLVGIMLNLLDNNKVDFECEEEHNDVVGVFSSMGCTDTLHCGLNYLLDYNWGGSLKAGDPSLERVMHLEEFSALLRSKMVEETIEKTEDEEEEKQCCICYASEADAKFEPCSHKSCFGCINRHLLNCQRCFFCKATVLGVVEGL